MRQKHLRRQDEYLVQCCGFLPKGNRWKTLWKSQGKFLAAERNAASSTIWDVNNTCLENLGLHRNPALTFCV
jgi:hypothetical protein